MHRRKKNAVISFHQIVSFISRNTALNKNAFGDRFTENTLRLLGDKQALLTTNV